MNIKNIPKHILQIMGSVNTVNFNTSIEEKYKLSEEQTHQLAILEGKIFTKEMTLNDFPGVIKTTLNLNENTANSIAFDVCEGLFTSAEPYLIGVKQLMARLKPGQTPVKESENQNIVNLKNK